MRGVSGSSKVIIWTVCAIPSGGMLIGKGQQTGPLNELLTGVRARMSRNGMHMTLYLICYVLHHKRVFAAVSHVEMENRKPARVTT